MMKGETSPNTTSNFMGISALALNRNHNPGVLLFFGLSPHGTTIKMPETVAKRAVKEGNPPVWI